MHTPKINAEEDVLTLQHFIRAHALCALVTETKRGMVASHIPMVLHTEESDLGVLRGHVARVNPQWKDFVDSQEALGIFTGPQHYISASWYPEKAVHGKEVPTWNYVAVHAYGTLRAVEDSAWLLEHLRTLTDANEVIAKNPWKVGDAPADFISKLSKGIVGLELSISRFEGKWKVSQNRNDRDASAVVEGLRGLETYAGMVMGDLVQMRRPR